MRNMKMALAVLALLAMAGTSFAALEISVDLSATQPAAGYTSWLVSLGGGRSFSDLKITNPAMTGLGTVVQANKFAENWDLDPPPMVPTATVWGLNGPSMAPTHKAMDTHMMIASPGIQLGKTGLETNVAYGPDGLAPAGTSLIPVVGDYYSNLGTFSSEALAAFSLAAPTPAGTAFMQVVLPEGTGVWMDVNTDAGAVHQWVGVPEPGTIALLIAGALCLLAVRRR